MYASGVMLAGDISSVPSFSVLAKFDATKFTCWEAMSDRSFSKGDSRDGAARQTGSCKWGRERKIGFGAGNGAGKSFEAKRKGLDFYI